MKTFLHYLIALAAGGLITSTVEYLRNYNLVDLIIENTYGRIVKLFKPKAGPSA